MFLRSLGCVPGGGGGTAVSLVLNGRGVTTESPTLDGGGYTAVSPIPPEGPQWKV